MSEPTRRGGTVFTILLALIFVAMAVEVVLLVRQNRELKQTIAELRAGGEPVPQLEPGDTVGPLELLTLDGEAARIAYEDPQTETLLLIFSPHCPACQANMTNWKEIEASGGERPLYYVSTAGVEETREFSDEHLLNGPVLVGDAEALAEYKVGYIPTTLVVGPGGEVRRIWVGVLEEDTVAELSRPA
jgi:peroxiredoxin